MTESKVDVLYDMRDGAAKLGAAKQEPAALRLLDAHDAVAELIDAHRELLTGIGLNDISESDLKRNGGSLGARIIRSRAALAACTPAKSEGR